MDATIAWIAIIIAGLMEPCWVYTLEKSGSFRELKWAAATIVLVVIDLLLLSQAMTVLGPGTSYAIWVGIGAVCTLIMGILIFDDSASWLRIIFVLLVIAGIAGIHVTAGGA